MVKINAFNAKYILGREEMKKIMAGSGGGGANCSASWGTCDCQGGGTNCITCGSECNSCLRGKTWCVRFEGQNPVTYCDNPDARCT